MNENGRKPNQTMHRHLTNCSYFQKLDQLYSLLCDSDIVSISLKEHFVNAVLNICRLTDQSNYWSQLSFSESYYITTLKLELIDGLKAFKELDLSK